MAQRKRAKRNNRKALTQPRGPSAADLRALGFGGAGNGFGQLLNGAISGGLLSPEAVQSFLEGSLGSFSELKNAPPQPMAAPKKEFSPLQLQQLMAQAAEAIREGFSQAALAGISQSNIQISITEVDPYSFVEGSVGVGKKNPHFVHFSFDHEELICDIECSCRKSGCHHSMHFIERILELIDEEDSPINFAIFGEDYLEQKRKAEEERLKAERKRNKDRIFSMLTQATGVPLDGTSLDSQTFAEPERVIWNLKAIELYGRPVVELKVVRQKETKSGGWSKGRETSIKNFMEMPREGWSKIDWALAEKVKSTSWQPFHTLSLQDALTVLEGTDILELNRIPAEVQVLPYELIIKDTEDGGWELTTSVEALRNEWSDDGISMVSGNGTVICSDKRAKVVWITTPASMYGLNRHLMTADVKFSSEDRDALLDRLSELQSSVPVRLPESLAGQEVADETESILMLRMKKTGVLEATVCVRDARQLLMLPGEGVLRRRDDIDGKPVQYVRDTVAERLRARTVVDKLSLDKHQFIRNCTWLIDDPDDVVDLLSSAGELAGSKSLTLVWHKESAKELNIIGSVSAQNVSVKVSRQRDWFGVNGTCKIGDQEIPLQDLLAGLRGASTMNGFIEFSAGQWAAIADDFRATLQKLADAANDNRGKLQLDASAAMSLSAIEEKSLNIQADKAWQKCMDKVRSIKTINPDPPASLNCDLREYQVEGFRWMCRLAEWGVGGILADDMGLGKTVQTLAVLLQRVECGPVLVIAPTSLGFNWEQECQKFAPSLTPRQLRESDREELITNASEGDVIICSYGLALRETELLQSVKWGTLVLDEAQNIKNSNAKTAKEIRKINADWKVALTGTPMENHLGELWSIFRAVSPGVLGAWEQFRKKFASPIEKDNDDERRLALSRIISPFILRRSKSEVLTDLPDRSESNLLIELTPEERKRYDQVRLAAVGELDSLGNEELSGDQRFKVLQLLTRLRQISCHVGMIDDKWTHGSSKLTMLMERMEQLKERGHRPLIFSQFTTHLALIKEACDAAGVTYQYLDGQTTPKARQQRVKAFQDGEGDAFLISLKAGGTGLNLTAADYVIHMDPWWNPAVEDQATDRAHRIGQKNNVMVYRIIAKGTIEEQILSLHAEKRDLVEGVLSGSEASAKMSTDQLADLIRNGVPGTV